jgi:hypothetical protein
MTPSHSHRRQFVRHPIHLPLAVRPRDGSPEIITRAGDLSEGGVSVTWPEPLPIDTPVDVELPIDHRRFDLTGTVASCVELPDRSYRIGLRFSEVRQSFKLKLAEQVLRIAQLKESLSRERGEPVTHAEAAQIWVEQYAGTFADLFHGSNAAS